MDRKELTEWIAGTYHTDPEFPWEDSPDSMVFRHRGNRKWFALVMAVPRQRLGLARGGALDVVNVKCGPVLAGSLHAETGIFPAYHMNKDHWVSMALDGSAEEEKIKALLDISFDLTAPKAKRGEKPPGLTRLMNIGKELERKLASVGIDTPEMLVELGSRAAYIRLKAAYPRVCLVHLYSLEGAVTNTAYNALSEEKKRELRAFSNSLKG